MAYKLERASHSNRFLDPFFESPVNYWPRKAVLSIGQDIGLNSLSDNCQFTKHLDWFVCQGLRFVLQIDFNILALDL